MKIALLITLLVSGMTYGTVAQQPRPEHPRSAEEIAKMRTDRLAENLGLSDEQQKEVYALNLEKAEKLKATREERAAKMAELRSEMKADQERLNDILTEEQREMLKQQQAERAEKMKAARKGRNEGKFRGDRFRKGDRHFHKRGGAKADTTQVTLSEVTPNVK
ncbi:periplasmic heavy metal sensor [Parapedobacter sp. ISTM3]|uniref:Heavy-metal resistance n=1 Tax=Parapedobacter luteus TaxID=623280 RepID=A0A1T5AYD8_9SPHI|nr:MULTISPECIES: periplasmic heavy metal sensor [Parapedobacter]MBK1440348.1 periplasmic heavy metal sensor [Parapedobacter sp. ISTM3]SKB39797.1 Heavy-metal resistance [Parapedobacter luteus]